MNAAARFVVRNMDQFQRELESADRKRKKAAETAVKVEGFRLRNVLKKKLRAGAPGGRQLQPLRRISTGSRKRKPLARLAKVVRYQAKNDGQRFSVQVGFLLYKSSKSWLRIAARQQEGFTIDADARTPVGSTYRKLFACIGARYGQRSLTRKYYFLKKSTKQLVIPARPIIDPFWAAHQGEAGRNIVENFKRKLMGERI